MIAAPKHKNGIKDYQNVDVHHTAACASNTSLVPMLLIVVLSQGSVLMHVARSGQSAIDGPKKESLPEKK